MREELGILTTTRWARQNVSLAACLNNLMMNRSKYSLNYMPHIIISYLIFPFLPRQFYTPSRAFHLLFFFFLFFSFFSSFFLSFFKWGCDENWILAVIMKCKSEWRQSIDYKVMTNRELSIPSRCLINHINIKH